MGDRIPTRLPDVTLRFATKADLGTVLEFIKGLAEYERLSHEVVANEEVLDQSLFGRQPVAEVVIADYQNTPAGFAVFFRNFSTFLGRPGLYLEDLFVKPPMRGKGIGGALLAFLATLAKERGCGRLEWAVLDWNTPAIDFYKKLGARPMEEWTVFRVTGPALTDLSDRF